MGECLYRMKRPAEAFDAFEHAVDLDSANLGAQLRLGELYLGAGAVGLAQQKAEAVLSHAGGSVEAMSLLGAAAAASGHAEVARQAYESVLAREPKNVAVAVAYADLLNRHDDAEAARGLLERTAAVQPGSSLVWLALAALQEETANNQEAERCYKKAVEAEDTPETNLRLAEFLQRQARIPEAEQILTRVDAKRPLAPPSLADFELQSGRVSTALHGYLTALSAMPAAKSKNADHVNSSVLAARVVEASLKVAESAQGKERYAAIANARAHLQQYRPQLDGGTAAILEAEAALVEADLPAAFGYASRGLEIARDSAAAHYVLGEVKYRMGDRTGARSEWQLALKGDSNFSPAKLAMASYLLDSGDASGSSDYALDVVRQEPGNADALMLLARVMSAQGRFGLTSLLAQRAEALDGNSTGPQLLLGEAALKQGQLGVALIHFQQALLRDSYSQQAIDGLTKVYSSGQITRSMLANMEKIAASSPPSPALFEIAGRLNQLHGWDADARRCLQRSLEIDPARKTAAATLARSLASKGEYSQAADSGARSGGNSGALLSAVRAEESNDITAAIEQYRRAIREGENTGIAANNLAWIFAQQGTSLDEALSLAQSARIRSPKNPAVLDTMGLVHLRRREYSKAIDILETAQVLATPGSQRAGERKALRSPSSNMVLQEIRQHLREAYLRAGRPQKASQLARKHVPESPVRWINR